MMEIKLASVCNFMTGAQKHSVIYGRAVELLETPLWDNVQDKGGAFTSCFNVPARYL